MRKKISRATSLLTLLLLMLSCLAMVMPAPSTAEPPEQAPYVYGPCDIFREAPTLGHFWSCYYWLADPYSTAY